MDRSVLNRVREVAADIFGVKIEEITPQSSPDSIESWDSLRHLNFSLALEQAFSIQFAPEDIEQMLSIELVVMVVEEVESRRQRKTAP